MTRIVKSPEIRKQELTEIALKQFLEYGYEKTSIRSILKEVDGEIGMFYHYFKSKNEIYKAALELYNEHFIIKTKEIFNNDAFNFNQKIDAIFQNIFTSIFEYNSIITDKINTEFLSFAMIKTLNLQIPLLEQVIIKEIKQNTINIPIKSTRALSEFIIFGMSSIVHDKEIQSKDEKIKSIKTLIFHILNYQNI